MLSVRFVVESSNPESRSNMSNRRVYVQMGLPMHRVSKELAKAVQDMLLD